MEKHPLVDGRRRLVPLSRAVCCRARTQPRRVQLSCALPGACMQMKPKAAKPKAVKAAPKKAAPKKAAPKKVAVKKPVAKKAAPKAGPKEAPKAA